MITTTACFNTFDSILSPEVDTGQGGRRPSSGIRMRGVVHEHGAGGMKGSDVELVMMDEDLQSKPGQRTHSLKRKGVNDLDLDIPKLRGVGSLEVRNKYAHVLYSIDILQEVTACVKGEGQDLNPACLTGAHKVSLLFGDKKSTQAPEHLTLYVNIYECKTKPDLSQLDVALKFGCDEGGPTKEDCDAWQKLKQVLDLPTVRVAYAENMAKIINKTYESDLDLWLNPLPHLMEAEFEKALKKRSMDDGRQKSMSMRRQKDSSKQVPNQYFLKLYADSANDSLTHENKKKLKRILESVNEARCTLGMCARGHPWAVRGTLHPWRGKKQASLLECDYNECEFCDGRGGKDGGLYTGETLLHIAIVQHDCDSAKWLLDRSAMLLAAVHHSQFPNHFHGLCS
jgi:hypothetical protein